MQEQSAVFLTGELSLLRLGEFRPQTHKTCVSRMSVQTECLVPAVPKWTDLVPGGKPAFQAERLAVHIPKHVSA